MHYTAIHCFTKELYESDNYFALFTILCFTALKIGDFQPLDVQKQATPNRMYLDAPIHCQVFGRVVLGR